MTDPHTIAEAIIKLAGGDPRRIVGICGEVDQILMAYMAEHREGDDGNQRTEA